MKSTLLIALLIVAFTVQTFSGKKYSDSYRGHPASSSYVFTIVVGLSTALLTWAANRFSLRMSPATFGMGLLTAVSLTLFDVCMIQSARHGPYSIMSVFMQAGGILVPTFFALGFGDRPSPGKWICILLIIGSLYLVSLRKGEQKVISRLFFPLCGGLFLFNGLYAAFFDVQQRLTGPEEKEGLIMVTFFFSALFAAILLVIQRGKRMCGDFRQTRVSAVFLLISCVISAAAVNLMAYILPLVNVTTLYTFQNAGILMLSVVFSCLFLKEKLSLLNVIGCVLTCLGLVGMTQF